MGKYIHTRSAEGGSGGGGNDNGGSMRGAGMCESGDVFKCTILWLERAVTG